MYIALAFLVIQVVLSGAFAAKSTSTMGAGPRGGVRFAFGIFLAVYGAFYGLVFGYFSSTGPINGAIDGVFFSLATYIVTLLLTLFYLGVE